MSFNRRLQSLDHSSKWYLSRLKLQLIFCSLLILNTLTLIENDYICFLYASHVLVTPQAIVWTGTYSDYDEVCRLFFRIKVDIGGA